LANNYVSKMLIYRALCGMQIYISCININCIILANSLPSDCVKNVILDFSFMSFWDWQY